MRPGPRQRAESPHDPRPLEPDDFYWDGGLMVLTRTFHLKRGSCCGNGCRHCPYDHIAVPPGRRAIGPS